MDKWLRYPSSFSTGTAEWHGFNEGLLNALFKDKNRYGKKSGE